jgi:hypothetical protein
MKSAWFLTTAFGALCIAGAVSAASLHTQVFTGSGTFTVPGGAKTTQEFLFTAVGGGGGGGGCDGTQKGDAGGGGSGAAGFSSFSGFNPSDTVTVTIGSGGAGGTAGGNNGADGGDTSLTYSGTTILTAGKGFASIGSKLGVNGNPGAAGAFSTTAGTTGLTLQASLDYQTPEGLGVRAMVSTPLDFGTVPGGGNPIGHAGTETNHNGVLGGGGLGCFSQNVAGGSGGSGVVIVTWVQ